MASPSRVPDESRCSTRHIHGQVYKCLAADGRRCPHGFPFACSIYCGHSEARSFCVQTGAYLPTWPHRHRDAEEDRDEPRESP